MTIYADTSFFVSAYVEDRHSRAADELVKSGARPTFTLLHRAEWTHAVARQVFYRRISPADAEAVYEELRRDLAAGIWLEAPMPDRAFDLCADLARRYGAKLGVRTLDSLHVACALELKAERFWTFDERQGKLAKAEGMKT